MFHTPSQRLIHDHRFDLGWYGVFALRGYQAYGNYTWVQQVQGLIGINQNAGDSTCGGGLRWITYDYIDKNTITNTCV
jgi:hypothetical protein